MNAPQIVFDSSIGKFWMRKPPGFSVIGTSGFKWNPQRKLWITGDPIAAHSYVNYSVNSDTYNRIKVLYEPLGQKIALSRSSCTIKTFIGPADKPYLDFQSSGIEYILDALNTGSGHVLLTDEQGLGKTIQIIGAINNMPYLNRIIIICPAAVKYNWAREFKKWCIRPYAVQVINAGDAVNYEFSAHVLIINYDILSRYAYLFNKMQPDLVIADESHYVKNKQAIRSGCLLSMRTKHFIFATGTPISGKPVDFWSVLSVIDAPRFGNYYKFVHEFCDAYDDGYGLNVNGESNGRYLNEYVRSKFMVRRRKADVLKQLPEKWRQLIILPNKSGVVGNKVLNDIRKYAEIGGDFSDDMSPYASIRKEVGLQKVPGALKYIKDVLETEQKVIIFAYHKEVIKNLSDGIGHKHVVITGDTSPFLRDQYVNQFQNDKATRVFIGNTRAAGVGITLTAASHVIFVEVDGVIFISQAEDRPHRIGQKNNVLIDYIVLENTIDAHIIERLVAAMDVNEKVVDGIGQTSITDNTILNEAIKSY